MARGSGCLMRPGRPFTGEVPRELGLDGSHVKTHRSAQQLSSHLFAGHGTIFAAWNWPIAQTDRITSQTSEPAKQ